MNKIQKVAIGLVLPAVLLLSGCAVGGSNNSADHTAAASKPTTTAAPAGNPLQKKLGDVVTYQDGFEVSVSQPAPYTPTDTAAGVVAGDTNIIFNVKYTNGSKENVSLGGYPQLNSGGVQASEISDISNNNIGLPPTSTLLPGQSITFQDAYSVKDETDLTYQITPAVGYDQAIFTSK